MKDPVIVKESFWPLLRRRYTALHDYLRRPDCTFLLWISLELVCVAIAISLLEYRAGWSSGQLPGQPQFFLRALFFSGRDVLSHLPIPDGGAVVLFFALACLQLHKRLQGNWRLLYLLVLAVLDCSLLWLAPESLRMALLISIYGVLAYARVFFDRRGGRLTLLVLILCTASTLWQTDEATLRQCSIWILGAFIIQGLVELGMRERTARQRAERLASDLHETQQQLRQYAMHAEETATLRERGRIAREIHDTLAQGLTATLMHIETGLTLLPTGSSQARQQFDHARELARDTLAETRVTILEVRSEVLEDQSLARALQALAARSSTAQRQVSVTMNFDEKTVHLPGAIALTGYRIVQEALTNVIKHSQATTVAIELSIEQNALYVTVTDDGVGFDLQQRRQPGKNGGFGCISMRERTRLLHGQFEIISSPGMGTQVVASLPIPSFSEESNHAADPSLAG